MDKKQRVRRRQKVQDKCPAPEIAVSVTVERCQWLANYLFPGVGLCAFGLWG